MERYSISEFSNKVGLTTYTLRYYEQKGLVLPMRDENDRRYYTDEDVKWIGFLLHLKGTGMLMNEIEKYVKLRAQGAPTLEKRRKLLDKVKKRSLSQIEEMKIHLNVLSHKIDWYDGKLDNSVNESFEEYLKKFK
jgi:DNA-binding transcriptional MerR regulator